MSNMKTILPAIALRGLVILPGLVLPIELGRSRSLRAVERAMEGDQKVFLVAQLDAEIDDPRQDDVYTVGTIARIRQVIKGQNDIVRILVEGIQRAELYAFTDCADCLEADVTLLETDSESVHPAALQAMQESVRDNFMKFARAQGKIPKDTLRQISECRNLEKLMDMVLNLMPLELEQKQVLLECLNLEQRYKALLQLLFDQMEIQALMNEFQAKVKTRIDKHQREYILREQLSVIREELGETDTGSEADDYNKKVDELQASDQVKEHLRKEIRKFRSMNPASGESTVVRNYIETLLELPWDKKTTDNCDLKRAEEILNRDHYGLEKVKDRILDFLAVRSLTGKGESPILCLVGPPGTGKTSIARSIAESLEKKYVRICLGGVRDEAEIRGHRRTYLGAMPGRIVDGLRQAGVGNPLMLLDEIDKASGDHKGDTASALLEVLDGEQNEHFRDHFVEQPIDLSEVLFLATANDPDEIPDALYDRMEIIEINSYTENEKFHIAKEHLVEKQKKANGLASEQLLITDEALYAVIRGYTREAGVRGLERKIGEICRKTARKVCGGQTETVEVTSENLKDFLGRSRYTPEKIADENEVGLVRGLAWTAVGGVTMEIEVNLKPGKGDLSLTGLMGEVMKESAAVGMSYIQSIASEYNIPPEAFEEKNVHIHIPEGATPKDGPSAGVTIATALLSAYSGLPVRADIAMTGEITIRGRVLPIGGLKEKLLAAKNCGVRTVCIPWENQNDLEDISEEIIGDMEILPVKTLKEILAVALVQNEE